MEYWEEVGGCCVCVPHSNKGPEFVVEEREKKEREREREWEMPRLFGMDAPLLVTCLFNAFKHDKHMATHDLPLGSVGG